MNRPLAHRPWHTSYSPGVPTDVAECTEPVGAVLERSVRMHGDRIALDFMGATVTYSQLGSAVDRAASVLHDLGVRAGDRVAIALPNCTQHVVAFYATLRLGAIVVEHNPTYNAGQLVHQLEDSGSSVVIAWEKVAERLAGVDVAGLRHVIPVNLAADLPAAKQLALRLPIAKARTLRAAMRGDVPSGIPRWDRLVRDAQPLPAEHPWPEPDDVAALQYTGGTTGVPRGAVLSHRNMWTNAMQGQAWTQHVPGRETVYAVLPFFHAFGLTLCLTYSVAIAATVVVFPNFDVDQTLAAQRRRPATFLPAVPPIIDRLAVAAEARRGTRHEVDMSSIKHALSGAMALPEETARRWEAVTGGLVVEGYGMTETSPVALGNPLSEARMPGTLGMPFPSTTIRVVDPEDPSRDVPVGERGELLIQGPQVFVGYWNGPDETTASLLHAEDGTWLRTGDIVVVDAHGRVTLVDRIKEIIIAGGFNVYPSQVEERLRAMPGVADAAVVGLPGGDLGERIVAAVVLDEGTADGQRVDLAAVRTWCADTLARYAIPRELVVLPELPRSQIGKVLRRVVRESLLVPHGDR